MQISCSLSSDDPQEYVERHEKRGARNDEDGPGGCGDLMGKHLGFLEKLGYVEMVRRERRVQGADAVAALLKLYRDFQTPLSYEVVLLKSIPPHLLFT
jgi:hypothetical protein